MPSALSVLVIVGVALPLALRSRWHSLALGDNAAVKKKRSGK